MARLILAVMMTVVVVAFGMANTHHVPVSLVFGSPVEVRQIFLLLTAVSVGVVGTLLLQQFRAVRRRRVERARTRDLVPAPPQPEAVPRKEHWQ